MVADLFAAIFVFALTVILGGWLAHRWQTNAAKQNRFFEISKSNYDEMISVSRELTQLLGRRIYSAQKICFNVDDETAIEEAYQSFKEASILWNERLLSFELSVRIVFRHAFLNEFELLQRSLATVSALAKSVYRERDSQLARMTLQQLGQVRGEFFSFLQGMLKEAALLNRQMHFGVEVPFQRHHLGKLSTWELLKNLFLVAEKPHSVVRSPGDFGLPVNIDEARFGVYEK
jgi:hypothetical protein